VCVRLFFSRLCVLALEFSFFDYKYSYVKYALAAYGDAAIHAATTVDDDSSKEIDLQQGNWTQQQVSDYIGLPQQDVVLMDVQYDSDATQLRHFVAVDHVHQKVVLAIRGTFCGSELAVDMTAYSRTYYV
jgi:hypothetical protein